MTLHRLAQALRGFMASQGAGLVLAAALAASLLLPTQFNCWTQGSGARCALSLILQWLGVALVLWFMLAAAALSNRWLPEAPVARRRALVLQVIGLTIGSLLVAVLVTNGGVDGLSLYVLQMHATFSLFVCLMVEYRHRARAQHASAQRLVLEQQALAQQLDAARIQLLQAQVEPHFLFNTLAHLRRLAQTDPTAARAMLADLLRYLQEALPSLSQAHTTLGRELSLVRAYLALHQMRMGLQRLRLRFDVEPGLDALPLPANSLLTLAENAIKHGIAPLVEGGEIAVIAVRKGASVVLEVADTGRGMGESSGHGTGLASLRARLAAQHGAQASLSLHLNSPRGLVARLSLPNALRGTLPP